MASIRAIKAVNNMVENGGIVSKAMIDAGFSHATAKNPSKLTNTKGFKELCEKAGLTDKFLLKALVDDIKNKPSNRKAELELGFKVKGRLRENDVNTIINNIIPISNVFIPNNNSNEEDSSIKETTEIYTGGDGSEQDNFDPDRTD